MSKVTTDSGIEVLKQSLKQITIELADKLGVEIPSDLPGSDIFRNVIVNTYKKHHQKVVVLIDEYDSPYVEIVNHPDMAEKVRDVLRNYYVQIKANDEYIRFVFITGISKFARFGIFSVLNNTTDISLKPEYAEMCGYTEDEIIQYFPDYLDDTAKEMKITTAELIEKMRFYYNGFSFDRSGNTKLYNPFSTLSFFAEKEFFNYWIDTGRSKMIADYMKNKKLTVEQFRNFPVTQDFAKCPGDVDSTTPEGFLYQCGYLTLRKGTISDLSLDYPNTEVLNSISKLLTQNIVTQNAYNYFQNDLFHALIFKNTGNLVKVLNRLLASIPYDDFSAAARSVITVDDSEFKPQEWLYRSTIFAFFQGCGVVVAAEVYSNLGRADLVVSHKGVTWVIELKVAYEGQNPAKKAEEALQQIINKNYATQYPDAVCVGIAIDDTVRQITEYRY
jgi:DNA-binding transcriptional regulator YhcF (GntR family)